MAQADLQSVSASIASTAADVTVGTSWPFAGTWLAEACYLTPEAAGTADAADYATFTVAAGGTTVATRVTNVAGGDLVADTPEELTVASGVLIEQGDKVTVAKVDTGSGLTAGVTVQVVARKVRA